MVNTQILILIDSYKNGFLLTGLHRYLGWKYKTVNILYVNVPLYVGQNICKGYGQRSKGRQDKNRHAEKWGCLNEFRQLGIVYLDLFRRRNITEPFMEVCMHTEVHYCFNFIFFHMVIQPFINFRPSGKPIKRLKWGVPVLVTAWWLE